MKIDALTSISEVVGNISVLLRCPYSLSGHEDIALTSRV